MWQASFVRLLEAQFQAAKKTNSRFSKRAFAKRLGVSIGTLSELMSGKLKISQKRAVTIISRLNVDERTKNRFLVQLNSPPHIVREQLPSQDYDVLADWKHRVVLFAHDLDTGVPQLPQLARLVGVSEEEIVDIRRSLQKAGLLSQQPGGEFVREDIFFETSDGPSSKAIQQMHGSNLALAKRVLDVVPESQRDFTSMVVVGSRTQLDALRQEIRSFYKRAQVILEDGPHDEIFHISLQAFPISFEGKG